MFKILAIDDDKQIIDIIKLMLEQLDYQCITELDPKKAVKRFKETPYEFDLIITDQSMPDMEGTELINELWLIRNDIKFIICSGYDASKYMTDYINESATVYFLHKPFLMDDLINVVNKALPFGEK